MKKRGPSVTTMHETRDEGEPRTHALPTINECRRMDSTMRRNLERVDDDVRCVHGRIAAEVERLGNDSGLFLRASTTVILSIAASLTEVVSERTGEPVTSQSFADSALDAAEYARTREAIKGKRPVD
jgi:hypothetical protein